jgi:hypothetical protein
MTQPQADFTELGDPEFLAERRHVREKLERMPAHHAARASLAELAEAMDDEFVKRAASAWKAS